jgi:phosphatidylglycerophosphatase A
LKRLIDAFARAVATGLGSGHCPVAPGTAGSLVGLLLFWPLSRLGPSWQWGACVVVVVLGTLASTRVARAVGLKDPAIVVVDEVAGQWVTLAGLPFTPATVLFGFLLFRAMDVIKPWPARDLERLPEGLGIMTDDVAAGVYAHLLVQVGLLVWPAA